MIVAVIAKKDLQIIEGLFFLKFWMLLLLNSIHLSATSLA
jgi:hypothetical protein